MIITFLKKKLKVDQMGQRVLRLCGSTQVWIAAPEDWGAVQAKLASPLRWAWDEGK